MIRKCSGRSFSFYLTRKAGLENVNADFIDYRDQNIYLDKDIREFFFDALKSS